MERIQNVLAQYTDADGPLPGRRQVNAALVLDDYAKLEVMTRFLKTTKRRLGSDLLAAAVNDAFDQLYDSLPDALIDDLNEMVNAIEENEEAAR